MRDAFGVEHDDEVAKALGLRPVADFVKGAASALRGSSGAAPSAAGVRGMGTGAGIRQAGSAVKAGFGSARASMPKIPKPTGTQMKIGGAIAGTGAVAGGAGYAAGKPDWQR